MEPDAYYLGFDRNWLRPCRGSDCYYARPSAKSARNAAATAAGEGSSGCVPAVPAFRSQRGQRFVRSAETWQTGAPPSRSPPALSRVAGCSVCGRRRRISRILYSRLDTRLLTCHGRARGPRIPHPVLIGHAASLTPYLVDTPRPSPRTKWTRVFSHATAGRTDLGPRAPCSRGRGPARAAAPAAS